MKKQMLFGGALGVMLGLLAACGEKPADTAAHNHDHGHGEKGHFHYHEAPHGGTAVVLGKEEFHIEFVRDAAAGKLQAYVLDGHMHEFVRIPLPGFEVEAKLADGAKTLEFKAVTKRATGETVGNTALFETEAEWLKTTGEFDGVIKKISIRGKDYEGVEFHFPTGNEDRKP